MLRYIATIFVFSLLAVVPAHAQLQGAVRNSGTNLNPVRLDNDFGMWPDAQIQYPILKNRRLQLFHEVNPRFTRDMRRTDQVLVRNRLVIPITKKSDFQVGHTFSQGLFPRKIFEHRIDQQLSGSLAVGKLAVYNRFRLEERFFEFGDREVSVRYRHQFRLTYPLYRDRLFAFTSGEYFVNLNRSKRPAPGPGIDQTRVMAGMGVRIYRQLRFDVAYQNQYINTPTNFDKMNHILYLGVSENF